jgi:hypothetical protein
MRISPNISFNWTGIFPFQTLYQKITPISPIIDKKMAMWAQKAYRLIPDRDLMTNGNIFNSAGVNSS